MWTDKSKKTGSGLLILFFEKPLDLKIIMFRRKATQAVDPLKPKADITQSRNQQY